MIAKGTPHNNGAKLGQYMTETGDDNERAELYQLRGFAEDKIVDAFRTIQGIAAGTRCEQPFFHCQVRTPVGETLTREQWERVADRIESKLGLTDQPRAIAFHLKDGHEHMHVAWSRIDQDSLTAKPLPFFKLRLKEVCRELEIELGLTRVRNEREPGELQAPTRDEYEQARRLGYDAKAIRAEIREAWERSDNGQSFVAALADQGLILAKGERRDYVVIDAEGGMHALGKRILGTSAAQTRGRMADIDCEALPTVGEARDQQQARASDRSINRDAADRTEKNGGHHASASKGHVTQKATTLEPPQPVRADDATPPKQDNATDRKERQENQNAPKANSSPQWEYRPYLEQSRHDPSPVKAGLMVADAVTGIVSKLTDFLEELLTGSSGKQPPDPDQDQVDRIIEERRADDALKRIRQRMERGESLGASDIRNLTHAQLVNLKDKGDDGIRSMIADWERDQQRARDGGRSRER
jgi:hypothetical protein